MTYYYDSGSNETSNYLGYAIKFNSGGTVSALNGATTINGTWSSKNDDSQLKLILNFDNVAPFIKLNDDWHVTQQNSSIIKMENVSGGSGGTDYLTLEKVI